MVFYDKTSDTLSLKSGTDINIQNRDGMTALMEAARLGHLSIVKALLTANADPNLQNTNRKTALIFAVIANHKDIVEELVKAGANLTLTDHRSWDPLIMSSWKGFTEISNYLIDSEIDINHQARYGQLTALICASKAGHCSIVRELIKSGAKLDTVEETGETALLSAVTDGHTDIVKDLIAAGAHVDIQNRYGRSALIEASAYTSNHDCIRELLRAGASVALQDMRGNTALIAAAFKNSLENISELIKFGSNLDIQNIDGQTALIENIRWQINPECATKLILCGASVNLQNNLGNTALIEAVARGAKNMVKELLDSGAQVNLRNKNGETALSKAVDLWDFDTVKQLIIAGADSSGYDDEHWVTALYSTLDYDVLLFQVLQSGDRRSVCTSIAAGANINRLNNGQSALHFAIQAGNHEITAEILSCEHLAPWVAIDALKFCIENPIYHHTVLPLLLAHKNTVSLLIRNKHQTAPLCWATQHQCLNAIEAFIASGACLDELNTDGENALIIAERLGYHEIMNVLGATNTVPQSAIPQEEIVRAPIILSVAQSPSTRALKKNSMANGS